MKPQSQRISWTIWRQAGKATLCLLAALALPAQAPSEWSAPVNLGPAVNSAALEQ